MHTNNAIMLTFLIIFFSLAIFVPMLNDAIYAESTTFDGEGINDALLQEQPENEIDAFSTSFLIILNLFSVAFWTFGLPIWLNGTVLLAMRVIFLVILYDKVRGI